MEQLNKIPFFFVVGRPRSGTTLLRTLFDAHPNVSFPPECQFIINLYPKYGKIV
ncbi:MAG: sulfotransferase [Bacteroidetes bacterium]|nr:sulfotransferase [Bacteroidota bacterium]